MSAGYRALLTLVFTACFLFTFGSAVGLAVILVAIAGAWIPGL